METKTFERRESEVRIYCRDLPVVFDTASGSQITDELGRTYLDFFAGAGALNYGHNDPEMKEAVINHLRNDTVSHALDLFTRVKRDFLLSVEESLLAPRKLDYRVQFTSPSGADANEAALKLARKFTGKTPIVAFHGGYHGMSAGAFSVSGSRSQKPTLGGTVDGSIFLPFENSVYGAFSSLSLLERMIQDPRSGSGVPAAVIVEPVQIQAGVFPATKLWLQQLRKLTREHNIVLILDEVQTGCGRTGPFFGFEEAGIQPDIITTAKSIGGFGFPMAMNLIAPHLDIWEPGEHSGTFRGNQLAFVTATVALRRWNSLEFQRRIRENGRTMEESLASMARLPGVHSTRGRGMIGGIDFGQEGASQARETQLKALDAGVLVERCGPNQEVLKLMPPINIPDEQLREGLRLIAEANSEVGTSSSISGP